MLRFEFPAVGPRSWQRFFCLSRCSGKLSDECPAPPHHLLPPNSPALGQSQGPQRLMEMCQVRTRQLQPAYTEHLLWRSPKLRLPGVFVLPWGGVGEGGAHLGHPAATTHPRQIWICHSSPARPAPYWCVQAACHYQIHFLISYHIIQNY